MTQSPTEKSALAVTHVFIVLQSHGLSSVTGVFLLPVDLGTLVLAEC